ncbi:hypothetical protein SASPL_103710 [Salvia splendens]|uniref:Pentatricopeptide repeat-containing protein n=1 Tax=Salvia splendens TaxID=180675 RepID=A0A4D8Y366_SALSN|nr:hypothetical protein SASPL_103707 [Salvia splendens]KAG6432136.1 hypothetical protein SASPL_103710 [Salvia splendens]
MERMQSCGVEPDEVTCVNMVAACLRSGDVETGLRIFNGMSVPSLASWNAMLSGYSQNGYHREAVMLFSEMQFRKARPDRTTFAIILSSCASMGLLEGGKQIHAALWKAELSMDLYVTSGLIAVYSKCSKIEVAKAIFNMAPKYDIVCWNSVLAESVAGARRFFNMMVCQDLVTWKEMIHGYAQNGRGEEAVDLFRDMIKASIEPDHIAFVAVLTACSHSGLLIDTGLKVFKSMQQEYDVEPLSDHYTCIVDTNEVKEIIEKMPYKDDPIVWEVLLSSCRVHGNVNLARRAADELFRLDSLPHIPSS